MEKFPEMNSQDEISPNGWEYFDKVYCISLDTRTDRRNEAKKGFKNVGLEKVEFVIVKSHPSNCEQGIYESHLLCIKKGIEENARNILIFEDDILFDGFNKDKLQNCAAYLSSLPDWSIFFLGCLFKKKTKTDNKNVTKIEYTSLAHAYAINRKFAEMILLQKWKNIPYDTMLSKLQNGHYYALNPSIAFQSSLASDNYRHRLLEIMRNLFGGLKKIQKLNEMYHNNKGLIIGIHILIISLIILFSWII